jgi:hypothetical protein
MEYFKGNMPVGKVWRKKPEAGNAKNYISCIYIKFLEIISRKYLKCN